MPDLVFPTRYSYLRITYFESLDDMYRSHRVIGFLAISPSYMTARCLSCRYSGRTRGYVIITEATEDDEIT